jgi:hypothetical protein
MALVPPRPVQLTVPGIRAPSPAARGRLIACLVALCVLATTQSCQNTNKALPEACRSSADSFEAALAQAPAPVRVDSTLLSECFVPRSDPPDIQEVGGTYVTVAERLADRARSGNDPQAALRLGYLIGASERGSANTQGIHEELVRRLRQELAGVDTNSPAFVSGHQAGRSQG